jgi:hypothetical protein
VHAVRLRRQGDVDPIVHEQELPGIPAGGRELACEREEVASSHVLLAEVDRDGARGEAANGGAHRRDDIRDQTTIRDEMDGWR